MLKYFMTLCLVSCLFLPASTHAEQKTLSGLNLQQFEQKAEGKVTWSNNPFVQPADDVAVSELKLSGIIYGEGRAAAIINSQIVKKGDKIGYNEIVSVEKEHIILRNENGLFKLSLRGGGQ